MPFFAETIFDVVHGAAHIVALCVLFAEVDSQGNFSKLGTHTAQCGNPHPENCSRSADGNSSGYSGDISSTYGGSKGCAYGLERCHGTVAGLFLFKYTTDRGLDRIGEFTDLYKARADTQIKPHTDDTDHGRNAPDEAVHDIVDLFDCL